MRPVRRRAAGRARRRESIDPDLGGSGAAPPPDPPTALLAPEDRAVIPSLFFRIWGGAAPLLPQTPPPHCSHPRTEPSFRPCSSGSGGERRRSSPRPPHRITHAGGRDSH